MEGGLTRGQTQKDVGVGPHPHRGFSPVTVIYDGAIHHRDTLGNDSIVHAGGTQWMVSGKGITHSERPPEQLAQQGGPLEFIQFWVNLPADNKMDAARYFPLQAEDTPRYEIDGVVASVITGSFKQVEGPIKTPHDVNVISLEIKKGARIEFDIPLNENGVFYQLNGAISVQDKHITYTKTLYELGDGESENIVIEAHEDTRILLLHGKPLNEKVSQYGPFVMNTQTEIMQAIRDAQMGKMGVLIEE